MGLVSFTPVVDGATATAASVNTPLSTIYNDYNGNVTDANIASTAAIAGSKLASSSVTATQINFGGAGSGVWWQEIGRTTLISSGDTISVTGLTAKKYLKVFIQTTATGGNISLTMQFNGDSGANYADRSSTNGGADSLSTSTTSLGLAPNNDTSPKSAIVEIINLTAVEKISTGAGWSAATGAASAADRRVQVGKWANTSAQISRIDVINGGTGDYAIGSEVVVLGHN